MTISVFDKPILHKNKRINYNLNRLDEFMQVYAKNLKRAVEENPDLYCWPLSELENVISRVKKAILARSYNKDGLAFKWTCKELEIKYTYDAIHKFINGE